MSSRYFNALAAVPAKAKLAFFTAIAFALLLVLAGNGYAQTRSVASLKGSYTFQLATPKLGYWSNSKECTYKGKTNTYTASNMNTYSELIFGVATFNGKGEVTVTLTFMGQIDQDASNDSIVISCAANGPTNTGGNIVYEPAATGTAAGTYTVGSNGAGSMTLHITSGGPSGGSGGSQIIDFNLAGYGSNGVAATALLHDVEGESQHIGTGVAALQ
jgi:hypothetical protein